MMGRLSPTMTLCEFENGYWYLNDLRDFAIQIGIPEGKRLRKDEIEVRSKSGVWYRLNRWREEQITNGNRPTYGDLVRQYVALNRLERFVKVPQDRYINFVAEFLAAEKSGTRADAIAAWAELKTMDIPKNYASWVKARRKHGKVTR
jgi:hypothetical protein